MEQTVNLVNNKGRVIFKTAQEAVLLLNAKDLSGKPMFRIINNPTQRYYPQYDEGIAVQGVKTVVNSQIESPLEVDIL